MAATCMAVCKGSRKKIRGIFISSCHLPVAVECDIVILSEPGPIPQAPVGQFCRHNLSPRGDGNCGASGGQAVCRRHNLSPRGDGNIEAERGYEEATDTTYPREGTETIKGPRGDKGDAGHNLSPRGDGNVLICSSFAIYIRHNLSPRGDGNGCGASGGQAVCRTQLIPARGRKRCGASGGQAVCRDTTYPREGTET